MATLPTVITTNASLILDVTDPASFTGSSWNDISGNNLSVTVTGTIPAIGFGATRYATAGATNNYLTIPTVFSAPDAGGSTSYVYYIVANLTVPNQISSITGDWHQGTWIQDGRPHFTPTWGSGSGSAVNLPLNDVGIGFSPNGWQLWRISINASTSDNFYFFSSSAGVTTQVGGLTFASSESRSDPTTKHRMASGIKIGGSGQACDVRFVALYSSANDPGLSTVYNGISTRFGLTADPDTIDYLIVGGGGGGGNPGGGEHGAGGGGGGVLYGTTTLASITPIVVGAGGAVNNNGQNSSFAGLTAYGGGRGSNGYGQPGSNGGSGGGGFASIGPPAGSTPATDGGLGVPGQGNNGGKGDIVTGSNYGKGGGGGAGQVGGDAVGGYSGKGGDGLPFDISGTTVYYGGGGGGCGVGDIASNGLGGSQYSYGGGGQGNKYLGYPRYDIVEPGGNGVVILRYATSGNVKLYGGTVSTVGPYTVRTYTTTGTSSTTYGVLLTVAPSTISAPQVGVPYTQSFAISNGVPPYTYSIDNTLPGLTLSAGTLSGTLTSPGSYTFTVSAVDSLGTGGSQTYKFFIIGPSGTGKISGPLLASNLRRNGVDLAFDNQVLYLDVTNSRVGFNTATPVTDLYTPTNIQTTNLIVSDTATIGNWTISGNTFQYLLNTSIRISPNQASNPKISTPGLSTSKLYVYGNTISTYNSSSNINITPNGTGGINFSNISGSVDVTVNADIHATGNITWDGNITLGNETTDTITFAAEVSSDILPSQTDTYNLGSNALKWHNIYANSITANSSITSEIFATNNYLGHLLITGNNISNTNSSNNIYLAPSGTGLVNFNSVDYIQDSNIYIPTSGDFVLRSTSNGYIKFGGTSGTIFPAGGINQRPLTPEVGQLRYNVDLQSSEVWDGTTWIPLQGTATDTLSANDVADEMWRWDIILG